MSEKNTLDQYSYELPPHFIAQIPSTSRENSRLLVLDRKTGKKEHRLFNDLPGYLNKGDALVINDSRVIPARLKGRKLINGMPGGIVEILGLRSLDNSIWEVLINPSRRVREKTEIIIEGNGPRIKVVKKLENGIHHIKFNGTENGLEIFEEYGGMPLPPYIRRDTNPKDRERYQTVYAAQSGSAAAPTAGLHFTHDILKKIEKKGVEIIRILLHVGLGTFKPVNSETLIKGKLHPEYVEISTEASEKINRIRSLGGRIITVGTTSARALESAWKNGKLKSFKGWTDIFIKPPYKFQCVDVLITNFHLPKSSLLMLVCAFAGRERILETYQEAKKTGYRFYSYGDAMLIL